MSFSITLHSRGVWNLLPPVPGCHSGCVLCLLLPPGPLLPPVLQRVSVPRGGQPELDPRRAGIRSRSPCRGSWEETSVNGLSVRPLQGPKGVCSCSGLCRVLLHIPVSLQLCAFSLCHKGSSFCSKQAPGPCVLIREFSWGKNARRI